MTTKKGMLGGNRLGAGGKREVEKPNYGRSTHNLSHIWKNTNAIGTVVPCLTQVALPGDTWEIDVDMKALTMPAIGPMFSSYKAQIDFFLTPMGLYNANMYMNRINQGLKMENVKFPQVELRGRVLDTNLNLDSQQVHSSCIFNYLGIRGLGSGVSEDGTLTRKFNAIPWLIYHDVVKNYYANKQEGIGFVVHNPMLPITLEPVSAFASTPETGETRVIPLVYTVDNDAEMFLNENSTISIELNNTDPDGEFNEWDLAKLKFAVQIGSENLGWGNATIPAEALMENWVWSEDNLTLVGSGFIGYQNTAMPNQWQSIRLRWCQLILDTTNENPNTAPRLVPYPLDNIDRQRLAILQGVGNTAPIEVGAEEPYSFALEGTRDDGYSITSNQEGLAVKTYQADQFNNWVATERIEGAQGLNEISAIPVTFTTPLQGKVYVEDVILKTKVYNMLMNIAVGDGTVDDWQETNWGIARKSGITNPVYQGGLSSELVFDEVISNSGTSDQPLGTLAGKGGLTGKRKGGHLNIKVTEPSFITAYVSYTPRLEYSQGNEWFVNLENMDDLHKPALDEIGFQDLITDKMAFWDTYINQDEDTITFKSAGKIPAWTDYMTEQNKSKGNFAEQSQQGWMVNNRRYEPNMNNQGVFIKDLTTYVDPQKWNNVFADARLDAQNIWTQIAFDMKVRRVMSAKIMPHM